MYGDSFFVVLLLLLIGIYYIYRYSGYREYKASLSYINSLQGDHKTIEYNRFFGIGDTQNLYGGILAAAWDHGILMWGIHGLAYYQAGDSFSTKNPTMLYRVMGGCAESLKEIESGGPRTSRYFEDIMTNPFIVLHFHMYKWRSEIHPGNYIQVLTYGQSNNARSATVIDEFNAPNNWTICSVLPNE